MKRLATIVYLVIATVRAIVRDVRAMARETWQDAKDFLEPARKWAQDRRDGLQETFEPTADALRQAWKRRPLMLRRDVWKNAFKHLKPDAGAFARTIRRARQNQPMYNQAFRLYDMYRPAFMYEPFVSYPTSTAITLSLNVRVEKSMIEVEPILGTLRGWGWEVDDVEDSYNGRNWTLSHRDHERKFTMRARIGSSAECELVTHEKEVVKTEKVYEVICEGERELLGVDL